MGMRTDWVTELLLLQFAAFLLLIETSYASVQHTGDLRPGFSGTPMYWVDHDGIFLLSNLSIFGFGLTTVNATLSYRLVVKHLSSSTVVWSANRDSPATNQDTFAFDDSGNAYLKSSKGSLIWSTDTGNKGVSSMELWDSGNLVLIGKDRNPIWQSFSFPTDTLLSNQNFSGDTKLTSHGRLNYTLQLESGNMILSASFDRPQPYWSMGSDSRITKNKLGSSVSYAVLIANSWNFYDSSGELLWQFIFSDDITDPSATWAAVLGTDGSITFELLQSGLPNPSSKKIPQIDCDKPSACSPYHVCYPEGNTCQCPPSIPSCESAVPRTFCSESARRRLFELVTAGDGISYPVMRYVRPSMVGTNRGNCTGACVTNCSCVAAFFDGDSGNCFLFEEMGSMVRSSSSSSSGGGNLSAYIKISSDGHFGGGITKSFPVRAVTAIVVSTLFVISCAVFAGFRIYKRRNKIPEGGPDGEEEEEEEEDRGLFEGLSGMPIRFAYRELRAATDNFSVKLGHGGFGSVYKGTLPDGTQLAVKQLESVGQGKKEFRAEVSIIGSIHHLHLVRLKGFCAEGTHRLLAYEFMPNGSLDKWLFRNKDDGRPVLDWETRYNIAVGTAKGLAYLHEDCDVKIVHCDIKPENVLLDERFTAKVSDFGLAKLMTREQSHVFTTMRGTRGYLAPEWITNYAISEKSDVYSYGMVLLELIGGRKNYDAGEASSEKSHFPTYAFKMLEEGRVGDIVDPRMSSPDDRVGVGIRVALWCIQDDMSLRPSMAKVVQMLEGLCDVPAPPVASPLGSRIYANFLKSTTTTSSSGPSDWSSNTFVSAVRLSGPR